MVRCRRPTRPDYEQRLAGQAITRAICTLLRQGESMTRQLPKSTTRLLRVGSLLSAISLCVSAWADTIQPASTAYRTSTTASGNSYSPVFSADGRSIAFVSHAGNLVTNDDSGPNLDLFIRDLPTGKTVLVSVSTNGVGGANDDVRAFAISADAQMAVFETAASHLGPADENGVVDVYVRDRIAGATRLV